MSVGPTRMVPMSRSIESLAKLILRVPKDPIHPDPMNPRAVITMIWEKEVDAYVCRKETLDQSLRTLYSLVWGQCSPSMKAKLEFIETAPPPMQMD